MDTRQMVCCRADTYHRAGNYQFSVVEAGGVELDKHVFRAEVLG